MRGGSARRAVNRKTAFYSSRGTCPGRRWFARRRFGGRESRVTKNHRYLAMIQWLYRPEDTGVIRISRVKVQGMVAKMARNLGLLLLLPSLVRASDLRVGAASVNLKADD